MQKIRARHINHRNSKWKRPVQSVHPHLARMVPHPHYSVQLKGTKVISLPSHFPEGNPELLSLLGFGR